MTVHSGEFTATKFVVVRIKEFYVVEVPRIISMQPLDSAPGSAAGAAILSALHSRVPAAPAALQCAEAVDRAMVLKAEADLHTSLGICEALLAELLPGPKHGRRGERANWEQSSSGRASTSVQTTTLWHASLAVQTDLLLLGGPTTDGAGDGLLREACPPAQAAVDEVGPPEQTSGDPQRAQNEERAGTLDAPTPKLQAWEPEDTGGSGTPIYVPGWDQTWEEEQVRQQLGLLHSEMEYLNTMLTIEVEHGGDSAAATKWRKKILDIEIEMKAIRQRARMQS